MMGRLKQEEGRQVPGADWTNVQGSADCRCAVRLFFPPLKQDKCFVFDVNLLDIELFLSFWPFRSKKPVASRQSYYWTVASCRESVTLRLSGKIIKSIHTGKGTHTSCSEGGWSINRGCAINIFGDGEGGGGFLRKVIPQAHLTENNTHRGV